MSIVLSFLQPEQHLWEKNINNSVTLWQHLVKREMDSLCFLSCEVEVNGSKETILRSCMLLLWIFMKAEQFLCFKSTAQKTFHHYMSKAQAILIYG